MMPNNRESEMLVTTQWLATHVDDPAVCVVDTRKGDGYETSHIDDFSVCTTWLISGNDYYLIDVLRAMGTRPLCGPIAIQEGETFARRFSAGA